MLAPSVSAASLTVDDVLDVLFFRYPPPAVEAALAASSSPSDDTSDSGASVHCAPWPTLAAYATGMAATVYNITGLTITPSTVVAAVARTFRLPDPTGSHSNQDAEMHWRAVMARLKEKHHRLMEGNGGNAGGTKRRREPQGEAADPHQPEHHKHSGSSNSNNSGSMATGADVEGGRKRQRSEAEEEGGQARGGGSGAMAATAAVPLSLKGSTPSATAFLSSLPSHSNDLTRGGGVGYDEDGADDPTSPRRRQPPSSALAGRGIPIGEDPGSKNSKGSANGGHGDLHHPSRQNSRSQNDATPTTTAYVVVGSNGTNTNGSLPPTQGSDSASSLFPSASASTHPHRERGDGSRSTEPIATTAAGSVNTPKEGEDGEDGEPEDLTASDALWAGIACATAEHRRQLHHLRYETPLTPEVLFFILQNYFFLVPGADVFLAPVPPNTIMEYNEVKSETYHRVVFAPLSLMDVKMAVRESRRSFHCYDHHRHGQHSHSQHDHRPPPLEAALYDPRQELAGGGDPHDGTVASPTSYAARLPMALQGAEERVLTLADLERAVWHIASNCAMFNAPESFYPQTGRSFAIACVTALVRYAKDQLLQQQQQQQTY